MNIKEIKEISNYRNLTGKSITFDKSLVFIIGENKLGKTNILELIYIIFASGKFVETDFYDLKEPVRVVFTLECDESDIEFFKDNFDIDNDNTVTIAAEQDVVDGRISYYLDTPDRPPVHFSAMRRINILYYSAQKIPAKTIDFKKLNGSGEILARLVKSEDDNGRLLASLGDGIQYAFNIIIQIIGIIHHKKVSTRPEEFSKCLLCDGEKKLFPLILLLDEPEIHQHPYNQRNMMKKIESLINNTNQDFTDMLRDYFDIDGLSGQIFVATHSPNILLNDYKQFVRVYKENNENELHIISGYNIDLGNKLYKHLLHNFIYLKEAMFSKRIVFVEGDTENGALPVFAKRKSFDLDEHGVGVVKLDGADSVLYYMRLYQKFGMKTYAIIDRDKRDRYEGKRDVFFTTEMDYEEDIYASFELKDYLVCCKEMGILTSMIGPVKRIIPDLDVEAFCDDPTTLHIGKEDATALMAECRENQLTKLKASKNASKGALLAESVTVIPDAFDKFIDFLAKEVQS